MLHELLAEYEHGHGLPLARLGVLGHGIPLASLGVSSAAELLAALPDVFSVRGRGARKVVVPAQATLGTGPGPTVAATVPTCCAS